MPHNNPNATPNVHPASRGMLPADPVEMYAVETPDDASQMLQLLVEEYARIGRGLDDLMKLARDPNCTSFHRLLRLFGEDNLYDRISDILSRCGVLRLTTSETQPQPERFVQINLPR